MHPFAVLAKQDTCCFIRKVASDPAFYISVWAKCYALLSAPAEELFSVHKQSSANSAAVPDMYDNWHAHVPFFFDPP